MGTVTVKIADLQIAKSPDVLVTYALGSCIGISMFDKLKRVGCLGHIMLPGDDNSDTSKTPMKFATTCIPMMVEEMLKNGCVKGNIETRIAGGASLVQFSNESSLSNIGFRNATAVKKALLRSGLRIIAEDTGKDFARTMYLDTNTGIVTIKTYGKGSYTI